MIVLYCVKIAVKSPESHLGSLIYIRKLEALLMQYHELRCAKPAAAAGTDHHFSI
jgi:hypothetical protein